MDPVHIILIIAPVVLAVLAWRGCLGRRALDPGPSREVGLVPGDLLIAVGLMVVGISLSGVLLQTGFLGPVGEEALDQDLSTMVKAWRVLFAQATGQLPVVLFFLWRAGTGGAWGVGESGSEKSGGGGLRGLWRVGAIPRKPTRDFFWGVLGLLAAIPLVMGTIMVAQMLGSLFGYEAPTIAHDMLNMLLDSESTTAKALIICSAVLVAPVLEEMIFRGLFQSVLVEWLGQSMRWGVVLITSTVFALIHMDVVPIPAVVGLFVFGIVLGWLYERTGSLWPSILVHVGFNSFNIIVAMNTTVQGG